MTDSAEANSPRAQQTSARRLKWIIAVLLVAAVAAVFWRSVDAPLLAWDDDINIYENPHIRALDAKAVQWMFTDASYARRYLPLGWLSLAINYQLGGLHPAGYHFGNVLLHAANTALVFLVLIQLLTLGRRADRRDPFLIAGAACGALLWAVHPLRVESVAWASARIYCQALLFLLLSFLAYFRTVDGSTPEGTPRWKWLGLSALAFAASLLTYPIAMCSVAVFVLLDFYPLRRLSGDCRAWMQLPYRHVWLEKLPFLVVSAAVVGVTIVSRIDSGIYQRPPTLAEFDVLSRAMQAFYVCAYYVWKTWLPLGLSPAYPDLISFQPLSFLFIASAAFVVGLTLFLAMKRDRYPGILVLWVSYLALISPLTGWTEHPHFASDRYSYLAGLCWSVVIAASVWRWAPRVNLRVMVPAVAVLAITWSVFSWRQIGIWEDTVGLHRHIIASLGDHPYRARIYEVLGVIHRDEGRNDDAVECFLQVLNIKPNANAHAHLGDLLSERGAVALALEHYHEALRIAPNHVSARQNLGITLATQGNFNAALAEFTQLVRIAPDNALAHHNLGLTLARLGKMEEAMKHRREAGRLQSGQKFQDGP